MMQGVVNQSCEAILPIVLKSDAKTPRVDAVIDAGFSGFLTLPSDVIRMKRFRFGIRKSMQKES
jgi:predicted aspartyl protease